MTPPSPAAPAAWWRSTMDGSPRIKRRTQRRRSAFSGTTLSARRTPSGDDVYRWRGLSIVLQNHHETVGGWHLLKGLDPLVQFESNYRFIDGSIGVKIGCHQLVDVCEIDSVAVAAEPRPASAFR